MALELDTTARAGEAEIPIAGAYLQARPLLIDKHTRNQTDANGDAVLVDDQPVTEDYWTVTAALRWWTADPAAGGQRLRTESEQVTLEIDLADFIGNPVAALYARLKSEPGFEGAVDI